jgi:pyruvate dehydrogenase E1 component alpha subunit
MSLARAVDAKVLSLQRQGRMVTYAPLLGEEATQVGSAYAMGRDDIFVPSFRQHAVYIVRGLPLDTFFLYWRGYEEGSIMPAGFGGFPNIVPVSTQIPHATGIAFAQKYKNTKANVVAYVGDGGTSEGDFYEGINFAGEFKLPAVFIIENNQWAISEPRSRQTAAVTLAQKGFAAGIKCVQVDGNDAVGVYKVVSEALARAQTDGPTLIECLTYRMSMHTTADDPTKYRNDKDVEEWKVRDPVERLRKYLTTKSLWSEAMQTAMEADQLKTIDAAVAKAETFKPDPDSIFEHVYSFMPEVLKDEYDDAVANGYWQETKTGG